MFVVQENLLQGEVYGSLVTYGWIAIRGNQPGAEQRITAAFTAPANASDLTCWPSHLLQ